MVLCCSDDDSLLNKTMNLPKHATVIVWLRHGTIQKTKHVSHEDSMFRLTWRELMRMEICQGDTQKAEVPDRVAHKSPHSFHKPDVYPEERGESQYIYPTRPQIVFELSFYQPD